MEVDTAWRFASKEGSDSFSMVFELIAPCQWSATKEFHAHIGTYPANFFDLFSGSAGLIN